LETNGRAHGQPIDTRNDIVTVQVKVYEGDSLKDSLRGANRKVGGNVTEITIISRNYPALQRTTPSSGPDVDFNHTTHVIDMDNIKGLDSTQLKQ